MFRSFTALFLICAVIITNFTQLFIYSAYQLNKDYIVAELCENKDKPELNCEGKCYLTKQLKQADSQEKKQEEQSPRTRFQVALVSSALRIKYIALTGNRVLRTEQCGVYSQ